MNDEQYRQHCRDTLAEFAETMDKRTTQLSAEDPLRVLAAEFMQLKDASGQDLYEKAPGLIGRLFTTYPDFAPTFPRELLWFFGGDCLHFMPDEEIAVYQQLDEERGAAHSSGQVLDLQAARAKLLKSK